MLLVFRGMWNDGTSASMYSEIMLRNKSIFQISTLVCLSSISICNLLTYLRILMSVHNIRHRKAPGGKVLRNVGRRGTCTPPRMQLTVTTRCVQVNVNTRVNCRPADGPFPVGRRGTCTWRRMQLILTVRCVQVNVNIRANCRLADGPFSVGVFTYNANWPLMATKEQTTIRNVLSLNIKKCVY
jgi:hypothetical protein